MKQSRLKIEYITKDKAFYNDIGSVQEKAMDHKEG